MREDQTDRSSGERSPLAVTCFVSGSEPALFAALPVPLRRDERTVRPGARTGPPILQHRTGAARWLRATATTTPHWYELARRPARREDRAARSVHGSPASCCFCWSCTGRRETAPGSISRRQARTTSRHRFRTRRRGDEGAGLYSGLAGDRVHAGRSRPGSVASRRYRMPRQKGVRRSSTASARDAGRRRRLERLDRHHQRQRRASASRCCGLGDAARRRRPATSRFAQVVVCSSANTGPATRPSG